jgi:hypothetical protein
MQVFQRLLSMSCANPCSGWCPTSAIFVKRLKVSYLHQPFIPKTPRYVNVRVCLWLRVFACPRVGGWVASLAAIRSHPSHRLPRKRRRRLAHARVFARRLVCLRGRARAGVTGRRRSRSRRTGPSPPGRPATPPPQPPSPPPARAPPTPTGTPPRSRPPLCQRRRRGWRRLAEPRRRRPGRRSWGRGCQWRRRWRRGGS